MADVSTTGGLASGLLAGRLRLDRRIGRGNTAEVWEALAPGQVPVAVKIISLTDAAVTQRELRALGLVKLLRHAFLLAVHEFWEEEGNLYVVMELADESLRDWFSRCKRERSLSFAELRARLAEAAEALDFLHGHGVLHRDVKPDNILLLGNHAKVGDCGLARPAERNGAHKATCAGTMAYMASEMWLGEPSPASDQYALGVLYVELRQGRLPFVFADLMDMRTAHLHQDPNLDGVPEVERSVLGKVLAKDPEKRFGSCLEFVRELQDVAGPKSELSLLGLADGLALCPTDRAADSALGTTIEPR